MNTLYNRSAQFCRNTPEKALLRDIYSKFLNIKTAIHPHIIYHYKPLKICAFLFHEVVSVVSRREQHVNGILPDFGDEGIDDSAVFGDADVREDQESLGR